eukprot:TRINITY_DN6860_c0_g1_i1.p1 TRINITY_DN6860_c0_g1~~TRINITY_DN6860_c0_g1_i1.p1  ORF type:complete len:677 (-),score=196.23 TRINITY_DN6860_c0_g1_i1:1093-3123(-)
MALEKDLWATVQKIVSRNPRAVATSAVVAAVGLAITQYYSAKYGRHTQRAEPAQVFAKAQTEKKERVAVDARFMTRVVRLIKICMPRMYGNESLQIVCLTALLLARTMLSIHLADVVGYNAKVLVDRRFSKFVQGVLHLGAVAVPASIVNSGLKYLTSTLALRFRTNLSNFVHTQYLDDMTFYKATALDAKIDNADQRIAEDIKKFADTLSELYSTTFKPVVDVALFTAKLTRVVGYKGPIVMFLYYFVSSMVLRGMMPSFARLTSQQQHLEGNFRFAHSRLITNAEEIAFIGGGPREKSIISQCYDAVYAHSQTIFNKQAGVNILDGMLVKYGATMVGYAVCAIPVFNAANRAKEMGMKESEIVAELTKNYVRDSRLLINLAVSIGQLILLYKRVTALAGYTARVGELLETLDALRDRKKLPERMELEMKASAAAAATTGRADIQRPGKIELTDEIDFRNVDIMTPDGTTLIRDLTFKVRPGENLLVTGPNGCGKSSMFRVLGELWPLTCGYLSKPGRKDFFYIPQKPYLALGTLRDQVIYPDSHAQMRLKGITDADLLTFMEASQLKYLVEREPKGWDAMQDWAELLSGGEKQRIAMARLYYNKPKYAILDECTSAVSIDVEHSLYTRCRQIGCTLITISHRKTLWKFHEYLLRFNDRGGYEFCPITQDMLPKE